MSWASGLEIDGDLAGRAIAEVDALNSPQKRPLLVDMTGTARLTRSARQEFTRDCLVSRLALLGRSAVDRVIANFALGVGSHAMPMRFFTDEARALSWLLERQGTHDPAGATGDRRDP